MKRKIKVLHIAQAAGGVERYIQMLLKYINRDEFENILICSYDYTLEKFDKLTDGFEQIAMRRSIGIHDIKAIAKVRKLIKRYNPDIVYAHSSKAGAIARLANVGMKNKCIYNPHGWAFNMQCSKKKEMIYIAIEKLLALFCDKIICISDAEKESALKKFICKEGKLQVIFSGIDVQAYEKCKQIVFAREDLLIPADAYVVGMVGRLSQQKAPDVFIRAAEIIKKSIPNAFFVMVGSGELQDEIQQYAERYGFSDSLLITGWIDEPMKYVEHFDVAMLLSRWEGFGLVLPEYMLAEKPIVATNVDAIPNIITDGENGLLVERNDYQAVAEAVIKLHNNRNLVDKLREFGTNCVYKRFNVERVAKETEAIFNL